MGDWLGTGNIAPSLREYRSFRKARGFARRLKLKSRAEWNAFCKGEIPRLGRRPVDIPATADRTYAHDGWKDWGDWLGASAIPPRLRKYRSFREARAFVRKLKLKNNSEWLAFTKGRLTRLGRLPSDIPAYPIRTYANAGWKGIGDWLGTGAVASFLREYRSFRKARAFVRKLKLKSSAEWSAFCKGEMLRVGRLPSDIPAAPWQTYASKGWKGLGDWLGTGTIAPRLREYRSFQEARAFARKLKLKNGAEWFSFCKGGMPLLGRLPEDIPATPVSTYVGGGWKGMGDWLGTGAVASRLKKFRPFQDARAFVRKLKLKNNREWLSFTKGQLPQLGKLPSDIPAYPNQTYADKGWKGLGDWLGNGKGKQ